MRLMLYRPPGAPPAGVDTYTRLVIVEGLELLIGESFLPRAAVRRDDLIQAITGILDIPLPRNR